MEFPDSALTLAPKARNNPGNGRRVRRPITLYAPEFEGPEETQPMAARKKAAKKKTTRKAAPKRTARKPARKTKARTSARGKKKTPAELIISKSRTKGAVRKCNVSGDFYGALDAYVREAIKSAEERASANGRKTLRPQDL